MSTAVDSKSIVREYLEGVLTGNQASRVDDYVTAGYVNHLLPPGTPPGPEGEKQLLGAFAQGFPGFTITLQDLVEQGDKIAARWRFRGTHDGSFQGIPATGRQVDVEGINIFQLEGDKLKENWPAFDMMGLMQQIGVIPAPQQ